MTAPTTSYPLLGIPEAAPPTQAQSGSVRSWRPPPGPMRNAHTFAWLATVLALVMAVDTIAFPWPGAEYETFNRLSAWITGGLLVLAAGSLACVLLGRMLAGRMGIVLYGCGVVGAMTVILGPGTGIDVLSATCLMFGPALLFARSERVPLAVACGLCLGVIAFVQVRMHLGYLPLVPASAMNLAEVRTGVVIVAACVGGLIVYLYWSAETARRAAAFEAARSDALLLNVLPAGVVDRLKAGEARIADRLDEVTILFADIAGFTAFAAKHSPAEVVDVLNHLFSRFDALCAAHGVEKLKTIGDGYMAVAGAPAGFPDHAAAAASVALGMVEAMAEVRRDHPALELRVGLNTGPVVAGVLGTHKFAYDVWGDTVNLASRLESRASPGTIAVSATTRTALGHSFEMDPLGPVDLKGLGAVPVWRLTGRPAAPGL
jgi:adenylate cyclase